MIKSVAYITYIVVYLLVMLSSNWFYEFDSEAVTIRLSVFCGILLGIIVAEYINWVLKHD